MVTVVYTLEGAQLLQPLTEYETNEVFCLMVVLWLGVNCPLTEDTVSGYSRCVWLELLTDL